MVQPELPTLDQVCAQALSLPCSPIVLPRLVAALANKDDTVGEIEKIILMDSALTAATLRLANSAFFAGTERIETVSDAIFTLGHRELFRLASLTVVSRWEQVHAERLPWEPGDYSRHSLCTALAAEVLAEMKGGEDPDVAYTAGLVCDFGKLALAYSCAAFYPAISANARGSGCTWEQAEVSVLGYNHAQVGGRLLETWKFPQAMIESTLFQFDPAAASPANQGLLALLHAARYVALSLGPGVTEGGYLFHLRGDLLAQHGYVTELIETAEIEVRERMLKRLGSLSPVRERVA